jgi:hypothetical protein
MRRRNWHGLRERRGNVIILGVVWIAVLVGVSYALAGAGEGLAIQLRLDAAMANAATRMDQAMAVDGPSRDSASVYTALVQQNLGLALPFRLTSFSVRAASQAMWNTVATGYVLWPLFGFTDDPTVVISSRVDS